MTDSDATQKAKEVLRESATGSPPHVLVAEDDDAMRSLVVDALRRDGYTVSEVPDGGRLLVALARDYLRGERSQIVDLIITDIRMPVCTGLQILEQLRAVRCGVPVILMTAFGDVATKGRASALGALLLDKPFHIAELRAAVAHLVGRRGPYGVRGPTMR